MKQIILFLLFFSCVIAYAQDTVNSKNIDNTVIVSQSVHETKNKVDIDFSHFLNHTNNMVTTLTIVIALLSLLVAIVSIISWRFIPKFNSRMKRMDESIKTTEKRNKYLNKAQDCLYQTFTVLITNPDDKIRILMRIYESKLFSSDEQDRKSALLYFYENGTKDNVNNITFLAENDDCIDIRDYAKKVLAIIDYKEKNSNK